MKKELLILYSLILVGYFCGSNAGFRDSFKKATSKAKSKLKKATGYSTTKKATTNSSTITQDDVTPHEFESIQFDSDISDLEGTIYKTHFSSNNKEVIIKELQGKVKKLEERLDKNPNILNYQQKQHAIQRLYRVIEARSSFDGSTITQDGGVSPQEFESIQFDTAISELEGTIYTADFSANKAQTVRDLKDKVKNLEDRLNQNPNILGYQQKKNAIQRLYRVISARE